MINNRQGGRRGRGRNPNGARPQNGAPRAESGGNRIDNRSRGNANQLHEKYKTLARDAQMQGDRVMTEYYHQFADHYFRVLAETRGRFDEQRPRSAAEDEYDAESGDGNTTNGGGDDRNDDQPRGEQQRDPRDFSQQRDARGDRSGNEQRNDPPRDARE
ncbi:MAG: DUF4167 domain-containing protein, partial [Sphingomonas sp.]